MPQLSLDFSALNHFFTTSLNERSSLLFNWGQTYLLPLEGKLLERACDDFITYFRNHPEKDLCHNLIIPKTYWGHDKETINNLQINYGFKEYAMTIFVYKECDFIYFDENNHLIWDFNSPETRYIYRNTVDKKSHPERKIKISGFTLEQKDIIWSGISVGYLDVPEIPRKNKKKSDNAEFASENPIEETISKKNKKSITDITIPFSLPEIEVKEITNQKIVSEKKKSSSKKKEVAVKKRK